MTEPWRRKDIITLWTHFRHEVYQCQSPLKCGISGWWAGLVSNFLLNMEGSFRNQETLNYVVFGVIRMLTWFKFRSLIEVVWTWWYLIKCQACSEAWRSSSGINHTVDTRKCICKTIHWNWKDESDKPSKVLLHRL